METLQELKEKYNNLNTERTALYNKIVELEQQELTTKFIVGECYLNTCCDSFTKILSIDKQVLYCIVIEKNLIKRDFYYLCNTAFWKKITSEQFKNVYLAVIKDIQYPFLEYKEKPNWNVVVEPIINSIDKEK